MRCSVHISTRRARRWGVAVAVLSVVMIGLGACDRADLRPIAKAQEVGHTSTTAPIAVFAGRVVAITDGDTIKVLVAGHEQRVVRFAEIDAPEKSQPWGNRSRQMLSELVYGRDVEIRQSDTDRYGRTVAHVLVDGRDINREMVAAGGAWAFRRYLVDQSLIEVEASAKRQRIGLWSMSGNEIIAPWDWRRGVRVTPARGGEGAAPTVPRSLLSRPSNSGVGGFTCGSKTRCSEMSSCAEAQFYLTQCRVETLDGNRDGEPCEQLCGTAGR